MKVGSIVECVRATNHTNTQPLVKGGHYTVRAVRKSYEFGASILLEEIVNDIAQTGNEWGYDIARFREIEFPPALEAEIKECLTREFELTPTQ